MDESVKLKIIRKNILPFYQNQLLLVTVHSIEHLVELCRKIEDNRRNILEFTPPSLNKNAIETDLSYKNEKKKLDNLELKKSVTFNRNKKSILRNDSDTEAETEQRLRDSSMENNAGKSSYRRKSRDSSLESRGSYNNFGERKNRSSNKGHRSRRKSVNRDSKQYRDRVSSIESNDRDYEKNKDKDSRERYSENRSFSRDRSSEYFRNKNVNSFGDGNVSVSNRGNNFPGDKKRDYYRNREYVDYRNRDSVDYRNRDYSNDRYSRDRPRYGSYRDRSRDNSSSRFNFPQGRSTNWQQNRSFYVNKNPNHNKGDSNKEIICYKCQGKNHFARYCTMRSEN